MWSSVGIAGFGNVEVTRAHLSRSNLFLNVEQQRRWPRKSGTMTNSKSVGAMTLKPTINRVHDTADDSDEWQSGLIGLVSSWPRPHRRIHIHSIASLDRLLEKHT